MKVIFLSLAVAIVLSGCSTVSIKKNEEQSSKTTLIKEIDVDGIERFSFSADFTIQENDTLKPKQANQRRRLNPQRVQGSSKQEPVDQESKNQSSLEQKALSMLDKNLNQKKWCSYGYELDEKYWQNTTFRILGHCID